MVAWTVSSAIDCPRSKAGRHRLVVTRGLRDRDAEHRRVPAPRLVLLVQAPEHDRPDLVSVDADDEAPRLPLPDDGAHDAAVNSRASWASDGGSGANARGLKRRASTSAIGCSGVAVLLSGYSAPASYGPAGDPARPPSPRQTISLAMSSSERSTVPASARTAGRTGSRSTPASSQPLDAPGVAIGAEVGDPHARLARPRPRARCSSAMRSTEPWLAVRESSRRRRPSTQSQPFSPVAADQHRRPRPAARGFGQEVILVGTDTCSPVVAGDVVPVQISVIASMRSRITPKRRLEVGAVVLDLLPCSSRRRCRTRTRPPDRRSSVAISLAVVIGSRWIQEADAGADAQRPSSRGGGGRQRHDGSRQR